MLKTPEALIYTMTAQVEVILSCGSIETPHLLLLSGIGDPTELQRVGITPVVDLHDVGKNLQDHPLFTQPYVTAEGNPLDQYIQNETFRAEALEEWKRSRTGIMGLSLASQTGWLRLPNGSSIFNFVADPSAGPTSPHFAMIFTVSQRYNHVIPVLTRLNSLPSLPLTYPMELQTVS